MAGTGAAPQHWHRGCVRRVWGWEQDLCVFVGAADVVWARVGCGHVCFKAAPQPSITPRRLKQIGESSKLQPWCSHAGDEGGN